MTADPPLLDITGLTTALVRRGATTPVIADVDLQLYGSETLALVGESGSGKSVTALSVMRLLPEPPLRITAGAVRLDGRDLLSLSTNAMCDVRGGAIGMVFQEPMSSLDPVMRIGEQIAEAVRRHRHLDRKAARAEALALLRTVRIPDPESRIDEYPHRLSGGMRQRVMIAMAIAGHPRVLIADEPTTALDVTVEAQIMALLAGLQRNLSLGMLLITHNLGLVARWSQRVAVMYAGRIVETGPTARVMRAPAHPYTRALLAARPGVGAHRLEDIPGAAPPPGSLPSGCAFAPRCRMVMDTCQSVRPALRDLCAPASDTTTRSPLPADAPAPGAPHHVACHRANDRGEDP